MIVPMYIFSVVSFSVLSVAFSNDSFPPSTTGHQLEGNDPIEIQRRERYRYRNSEVEEQGSSVATISEQQRDERTEDNLNPLFPPRTDSFWEVDENVSDGSRSKKIKENSFQRKSRERPSAGRKEKSKRPNIILILTDDQDIELGSMEYMPETLKVFRENGVEFRHGYVTTPMCCPSRSSMLTGLYVHNHQVYTNNDNCSSIQWRLKFEEKTFASYLKSSGYYTSYIGKYLNKYDGSHIPVGWNEWNALLMNSKFYNYTVNRNGRNLRYGNSYSNDYYPDSITNDTIDFIHRMANPIAEDEVTQSETTWVEQSEDPIDDLILAEDVEGSGSTPIPPNSSPKSRKPDQPFLLVVSYPSPHGPEDSAPQYSHLFLNETLSHQTPAYNYAPNSDKQWILQVTGKMSSNLKDFTNLLMSKRLQTLQSVDIAVKKLFDALKKWGFEDETYVFYTSDHGYHIGQFGLIKGKSMPFEFDIRVPFFLKTPGDLVSGGTTIQEPVLNIDLAPTFLELGGIPVPADMDGRSIVPLIQKYSQKSLPLSDSDKLQWTQSFLIESSGRRESNSNHINITREPMIADEGGQVSESEDVRAELNELCDMHPHPCVPGQKKYCRREKDRIRFRKCRAGIDFPVEEESKLRKCQCYSFPSRSKRNTQSVQNPNDYDWESERQRIDSEIEALKTRIDELRERKRVIKQQQISLLTYVPKISEKNPTLYENQTNVSGKQRNKKKNQITTTSIPLQPSNSTPAEISNDHIITTKHISKPTNKMQKLGTKRDEPYHISVLPEPEDEDETFPHENFDDMTTPSSFLYNSGEDEDTIGDDEEEERMISKQINKSEILVNRTFYAKENSRKAYRGDRDRLFVGFRNRSAKNFDQIFDSNRDFETECDCSKSDPRWLRQRERDERKRKKLMSKLRKKQRFLNRIRDPTERHQAETCGTEDKMINCFWHDKQHWRVEPLWTGASFCFCMNSHNNTFSCLRSINSTHNYLYCQFITGFKMYFDLTRDPFQIRNSIGNLQRLEEDWMMTTLQRLKQCQGQVECHNAEKLLIKTSSNTENSSIIVGHEVLEPSIWEKIFGTFRRKKNRNGRQRKVEQQHDT